MVEKLDRYEILEEIGQGGFAIVYRARDTQLDRLVALKELRPILLNDPGSVKDFRREARNIARLDHPNIVTIYDVYETQPKLFIVMQLVDGSSLAELIARQGRLSWSETVEVITKVAAGLDYAHRRGILHRDLKPANILLDSNHGPMLSDFGLAKLIGKAGASVTAGGGVVGTPHYIAPEVWEGQGAIPQSDLYALGCILYETLTGEKLFPGETPPAVMMAHFRALTLPKTWPEGVPPNVADVLTTALAPRPADRYATAGEMAETLATLVKSELATPQLEPARSGTRPVAPPILTTKLYPPPIRPTSSVVARPRLIERLNEGLHRKLTLISAPAGFGKTTLVSDWLRQIDLPTAWLSLDEGDNDPTRFLTYLIAALQQIDPDIGQTVQAMLESPQPPPPEALMTALINDIAATSTDLSTEPILPKVSKGSGQGFALVLDDYHVIEAQHLHDALTFLLDHLPPPTDPPGTGHQDKSSGQRQGMHLVIATRTTPPLPLPRLRSQGQLTELGAADLRFMPDEASTFLNRVTGLALSAEDVSALEARTEGWIAGLQLAALSMQGREDIPAFIRAFTGSHRYILDYLVEEVLRRQPESIQTFLLQTSILDRLCGSLCDAVLSRGALRLHSGQAGEPFDYAQDKQGSAGEYSSSLLLPSTSAPLHLDPFASSQEILVYLEQTNLFIIPLDDERRWYRYHHLFADFLQHRLRVTQPEVIPELYLRASVWFEAQGQMGAAIQNVLAAEDFERAAGLVEQSARTMGARGEFATLLGWLKALPDELVRARPQLCLAHAWALFIDEQFEAAESRLQDAETSCERQVSRGENPEVEALLGEVAAVRAVIAFHTLEDMPRTIELSHQALERLPDRQDNLYLRGQITMQLGMAYGMSDDLKAAHRAYTEAWTLSQTTDHALTAVLALHGLAQLEVMRGHLHQAAKLFEQALQFTAERAGPRGQRLPIASVIHVGLGELLRQENDLEAATRHLLEGIELSKQLGLSALLAESYLSLARVKQAWGDMDGAIDTLQQAEQLAQRSHTVQLFTQVAACRVRLWLSPVGGNLAAAARWARDYHLGDELSYLRQAEYLALARVLISLGQADEALELLVRLQQAAESAERMGDVIEIRSLQALAYHAQGTRARAMAALEQALLLAEPEGYVRTFVDEGEPMAALLRQAMSRGIAQNYVSELLAAFDAEEQRRRLRPEVQPEGGAEAQVASPAPLLPRLSALVEPLSERELEVLRLLKTELSGPEIARELTIALTTLRFHTRNIYSKLNVNSRRAAVRRAEELNLL